MSVKLAYNTYTATAKCFESAVGIYINPSNASTIVCGIDPYDRTSWNNIVANYYAGTKIEVIGSNGKMTLTGKTHHNSQYYRYVYDKYIGFANEEIVTVRVYP